MNIRQAKQEEIETVLGIIDEGRSKMRDAGNHSQWSNGYPSRELMEQDIRNGNCFLVVDNERPVAVFTMVKGPEPTYAVISDGSWMNDRPYYVIHRVASVGGVHGIMKTIFDYCFGITDTIRVDTHEDNIPMRSALERNGFKYCGIIHLADGAPRFAYMKTKG